MHNLLLSMIPVLAGTMAVSAPSGKTETAVLAGGCFWCIEAVFERLEGVQSVEAGYAGGTTENPTYDEVSSGTTGHAEVARITFDPAVISYEKLLEVFWSAHDPTTLNRQGADVGTQYRSAIFWTTPQQKAAAERSLAEARKLFSERIVTELRPLEKFYKAEEYHQDYFRNHPNAPYCTFVIKPKLHKLKLD